MQLAARIRHRDRLIGQAGRVSPAEALWMLEHPPGPDWEILLTVEEGPLADALQAACGGALVSARVAVAGRAVGAFTLSTEDVAYLAKNPGAGRFLVAADAAIFRAILATEEEERTAGPTPPAPATDGAPPVGDATGVVSAPMVT